MLQTLLEEMSDMINVVSLDSYNKEGENFKSMVTPSNLLLPFYFMLHFIEPPIHGKQRMYRIIKTMLF